MKKIVFSSVLVFSILNAKTLTTKDDFLNWSATPSNISSKITDAGANTLDYWENTEFAIDPNIFNDFKRAVEIIPTAKYYLEDAYNSIIDIQNNPLFKSNYDNLKKLLNKNSLNKHNDLDFNDLSYSKLNSFFDAELKNKIDEQISAKEAKIQELEVDANLVSKIRKLKQINDEIATMASNFSQETLDAIKDAQKSDNISNDCRAVFDSVFYKAMTQDVEKREKMFNENFSLLDYRFMFEKDDDGIFSYLRNNVKDNKTFLSVLIKENGVDELIGEVEKQNYDKIQTALNSDESKDIVELQTIKDILGGDFGSWLSDIKTLESQTDTFQSFIQNAEDKRVALEQAIKNTTEFKELLYLVKIDNVLSQHLPNVDNDTSGAELFEELAKLDTSRDFKDQDPKVQQKVQTKADTFATKVLENKKSEVMTNVTAPTLVQLNNMTKRLGELRDLNARYGAWLRSYGGQMSADSKHINYYSIQLGADKVNRLKNDKLIIGFLAGFDKINGYIDSQTYSVGGYVSYLHSSGVFSDMVAKYTHTKHEKSGHEFDKQHSFLASFESGYRFGFGYEFYVEQSLEFITGYIGKYQDKVGTSSISIDAYTPFIIKPQAHIGGMVGGFSYRLGVGGVLNTAEQEAKISLNMDEISKGLKADGKTKLDKNNHGFVSLGGAYKVGKKSRISLSAERSFGGKITNDYEINATIRVGF